MTRSVFHDFADLVISTDAAAAAHAYSRGVQLLITSTAEAEAVLRDAVRADPNFALARVALALAVDARGLAAEDHECADWADTTLAGSDSTGTSTHRSDQAGSQRRARARSSTGP